MKKTIELEYGIGEEVVIKVLAQKGIVSSISWSLGGRIRYQVEYSGGSEIKCRWMDGFELEEAVEGSGIGFASTKEKK